MERAKLTKIELNTGKDDLSIYIDVTAIVALHVQMPLESTIVLF